MRPVTNLSSIEGLIGSAQDDFLTGLGGNDLLAGAGGADTLDGGGGTTPPATRSGPAPASPLRWSGRRTTTGSGGDAAGDKISNFENITGSDSATTSWPATISPT